MTITLTTTQTDAIRELETFHEQYEEIRKIISETPGHNPDQAYWFEQASYYLVFNFITQKQHSNATTT